MQLCHVKIFVNIVEIFSNDKTSFLTMFRLSVSIKTMSREIETPKLLKTNILQIVWRNTTCNISFIFVISDCFENSYFFFFQVKINHHSHQGKASNNVSYYPKQILSTKIYLNIFIISLKDV